MKLIRTGDVEFEVLSRCATDGDERGQPLCGNDSGLVIADVPVFCELVQGHQGRHVHTNGGHACWERGDIGPAQRLTVRGFHIGHQ